MRTRRTILMAAGLFALLASAGAARAVDLTMEEDLLRQIGEVRVVIDEDAVRCADVNDNLFVIAEYVNYTESMYVFGADPHLVLRRLDRAAEALRRMECQQDLLVDSTRICENTLAGLRARGEQIQSRLVVKTAEQVMVRAERNMADLDGMKMRSEAIESHIGWLLARILRD